MLTESCPIDHHTIDEHVARLNGFFSFSLLIIGYYTSLLVWVFLLADFLLRATKKTQYSPLIRFSKFLLNLLHIPSKPIDRAPKLFAARIGLLMNLLLLTFVFLGLPMIWKLILAFFLLATGLEAFFNYCLGCKIYALFPHSK